MKRRLLIILLALVLSTSAIAFVGCTATDPWTDDLYTDAHFKRVSSDDGGGYWRVSGFDVISSYSTGTQLAPNVSSMGGYRLDFITEYVFIATRVGADWDGVGDGIYKVYFEVNEDNTAGNDDDTTDFQLECWHKIEGERTCDVYSLDSSTVVGKADQHDLFSQEISIENIRSDEIVSFRINLNTIDGEISNVIINYIEFMYPTYLPAPERS